HDLIALVDGDELDVAEEVRDDDVHVERAALAVGVALLAAVATGGGHEAFDLEALDGGGAGAAAEDVGVVVLLLQRFGGSLSKRGERGGDVGDALIGAMGFVGSGGARDEERGG